MRKTISGFSYGLLLMVGLVYFGLYQLFIPAPSAKAASIKLVCKNNPFQGDVLFITDLDQPLEFLIDGELVADVPEGYTLASTQCRWTVSSGTIEEQGIRCRWSHPKPGVQNIHVSGTATLSPPASNEILPWKKSEKTVAFESSLRCLVPLKVEKLENGKINGYEVGVYPDPTKTKDLSLIENGTTAARVRIHALRYSPPKLFYEVTPQTFPLRIFKHYTLGDFDLDPRFLPLTYPRYIAVHPDLLKKIDRLEQEMIAAGVRLTKFKLIYGFRSPAYNIGAWEKDKAASLKEPFSSHMYGMAADMIVDEDDNLIMDDLNHDGVIDLRDAQVLLDFVDRLDQKLLAEGSELVGGAGIYPHHDYWERGETAQSPYVHMDVRGYTREDGSLIRWEGKDILGVLTQKNPYHLTGAIPKYPF